LTLWTLIVFTGTFRLAYLQQDVQDDFWHAGSSYAASEFTPDEREDCGAEDNADDDRDIDLIFVNEEHKLNIPNDCTQKPSSVFSNNCVKIFNRPLINPYWETLFDKIESPSDVLLLASLPLRSPPYFTR
jgi:hypothetical protein